MPLNQKQRDCLTELARRELTGQTLHAAPAPVCMELVAAKLAQQVWVKGQWVFRPTTAGVLALNGTA
jgi:hypothetical protein